jgi:dephospho-CoA kinase
MAPISIRSFPVARSMSSETENTEKSSLRVLGVCGGIGSGKSYACKLLMDKSDDVIAHLDADTIAHVVYTPGNPALAEIAEEFGSQVLQDDGTINRKELGAIVFSDPSKMAILERIVWPYVKLEIQRRLQQLQQEHESGIVLLEAAVLLDAEWEDIMDAVWTVKTPAPIALERLVSNRNFTREEAQKRIDAQEPRRGIRNLNEEVENGVVTRVIENTGTEEDLQEALLQALHDPTAWKQPL